MVDKQYSKLNKEMFAKAKKLMVCEVNVNGCTTGNNYSRHSKHCWHIGWCDVSAFVDWIEEHYDVKEKP